MSREIQPPAFGRTGATRVLVEATEWATREIFGATLRSAGYDVAGCGGPEGCGERCAMVSSGGCSAAADADVIVHALRHSDERNREVLRGLQRRYPGVPLVVEVPAPRVERFLLDFERCHVVPYPMTSATLLEGVRAALEG